MKKIAGLIALEFSLIILSTGINAQPIVEGLYSGDESNYFFLANATDNRGSLYYNRVGNTLYLLMRVSPNVSDNVFGENSAPLAPDHDYLDSVDWNSHNFKHLVQSDHIELTLECGDLSYNWLQDYIYDNDTDSDPVERDWLSTPGGPDGGGTVPSLISTASSLQWNMNNGTWDITLGGNRTTDTSYKSPDPINNYPGFDPIYQWEWAVIYEMSIDVAECNGNEITISVVSAHNSPSKDVNEDVPIPPIIIPPVITTTTTTTTTASTTTVSTTTTTSTTTSTTTTASTTTTTETSTTVTTPSTTTTTVPTKSVPSTSPVLFTILLSSVLLVGLVKIRNN